METRELMAELARKLVEKPDAVAVSELKGKQATIIELRVDKGDVGKVIGKGGRTAMALRTILGAVSSKTRKTFVLEIIE